MRILWASLATCLLAVLATLNGQGVPASTDRAEEAYRINNAGVAALERYDYKAAVSLFRDALRVAPTVVLSHLNLAIALHHDGQSELALREAQTAAQLLPGEPRAWFLVGLAARGVDDVAAAAAFGRVLGIDPFDAAALVNIGQIHIDNARYSEAVDALTKAVAAEPFNATAAYSLGTALIRARRIAEGQAALARFQTLRNAPYATLYSAVYLQQGRYAEALVSTGSEPQLVEARTPATHFVEVTTQMLPGASPVASWAALADLDGDRDMDLLVGAGPSARVLTRGSASWTDGQTLAAPGATSGAIAADYDNDGRTDLLVLANSGVTLWRQASSGGFEDATAAAGLGPASGGRTVAWADLDHDGDTDFLTAGDSAGEAWRNNGNGTFVKLPSAAGLEISAGRVALVATDFDGGRDIDIVAAGPAGTILLKNLREGRFEDTAASLGLPSGHFTALAVADRNADGRSDFYFARSEAAGVVATSRGTSGFTLTEGPMAAAGARAAQFVDYDADGLLDLVTYGATGLRIHRFDGAGWVNASAESRVPSESCEAGCTLASGDIDDDGDLDLVTTGAGHVRVWRNDGPTGASVSMRLSARVSNRSAIGARLDVRAGSLLRLIETSSASPAAGPAGLVIGLGRRRADVVRVIWPSGIVQAESTPTAAGGRQRLDIAELDRKPSSCPYLYTWNGSRFEFVTDFLGGGEIGYWQAPGQRGVPDPEEFVRIRGDQLRARNGRYELRVTNELEEALFVDRLSLVAVTHPAGTEVYPNEGMFSPPFPPHRLFVTRAAAPPALVVDEHGHNVSDLIARVDRRAPSDYSLERFRGYASDHALDMTLAPREHDRLRLLLTAWTDYAFSSDNLAAAQGGLSLRPPSLEIFQAGKWRTIVADIGVPVGRPQTVVVDLTGRVPTTGSRLRIRTNMRIHWDQVLVDSSAGGEALTARIEANGADLRWRGYSAEVSPDGRPPFSYDYERVGPDAPWKLMPGRYTREGDVRALVAAVDDRFVASRPGDEIALSFPALPPPPEGWTRTFLLHADGFSKEMDINSASPDVAAPLPYHGMVRYPYDPSARQWPPAMLEYLRDYNTRVVSRRLPLLAGPWPGGTK